MVEPQPNPTCGTVEAASRRQPSAGLRARQEKQATSSCPPLSTSVCGSRPNRKKIEQNPIESSRKVKSLDPSMSTAVGLLLAAASSGLVRRGLADFILAMPHLRAPPILVLKRKSEGLHPSVSNKIHRRSATSWMDQGSGRFLLVPRIASTQQSRPRQEKPSMAMIRRVKLDPREPKGLCQDL